jgi:hypothetical protein
MREQLLISFLYCSKRLLFRFRVKLNTLYYGIKNYYTERGEATVVLKSVNRDVLGSNHGQDTIKTHAYCMNRQ